MSALGTEIGNAATNGISGSGSSSQPSEIAVEPMPFARAGPKGSGMYWASRGVAGPVYIVATGMIGLLTFL